MNESLVSVCIPVYEMSGKGVEYLKELFNTICGQTYKNIQIVVSDHSNPLNDDICNFMKEYDFLDIPKTKYIRNNNLRGSMGANLNCAVENADGEYIKIMCQDDVFYGPEAIKILMNEPTNFMACGCSHFTDDVTKLHHTHNAVWTDGIATGYNKIGAPSVIFFKRDKDIKFDPELSWLVDCEFYYRMSLKYGPPKCIDKTLVLIREWPGSTTNTMATPQFRQKEVEYVKNKLGV